MTTGGSPFHSYERSNDISPFNSKFDWFLANNGHAYGQTRWPATSSSTARATAILAIVDGRSTTLTPGQIDTGTTASVQPLFTCHGFANEGLPLNPRISLFYESTPDGFGFTPNPDGFRYRDLGLGNFLRSGPQSFPDPNQPGWLRLRRRWTASSR